MSQAKLVEALIKSLPYPTQIKNIDFSEEDMVRFEWRGATYLYGGNDVAECENGCLRGSDRAILMRTLLERSTL
jgi:hypothetical protein